MREKTIRALTWIVNSLELSGILLTLFLAFALQIIFNELPCPLCLLQRVGLLGVAFGLLLNLRFGMRPSHYAIALLSALFTGFVALRQIALHVIPGTPGYGDTVFGLHLYTWSFIISIAIVITTTIILGFDKQYHEKVAATKTRYPFLTKTLFLILAGILMANIIGVFLECGFKECPDNPTQYLLLSR